MRNFTNRRGEPREWYSDRGTNFIGAERELRKLVKQNIDFNEVATKIVSPAVKWSFNPPTAAHMGGCWERLIRSIKSALKVMLPPDYTPSPEILASALIEVEAIINSRPLVYISLEDGNQEALTPQHFLLGSGGDLKSLGNPSADDRILRSHYKTSQIMAQRFWRQWILAYRPTLLMKSKWYEKHPDLREGDIVVILDENDRSRQYPSGQIINVHPSRDGHIRSVTVQTKQGIFERPTAKLARLNWDSGTSSTRPPVAETQPLNSQ